MKKTIILTVMFLIIINIAFAGFYTQDPTNASTTAGDYLIYELCSGTDFDAAYFTPGLSSKTGAINGICHLNSTVEDYTTDYINSTLMPTVDPVNYTIEMRVRWWAGNQVLIISYMIGGGGGIFKRSSEAPCNTYFCSEGWTSGGRDAWGVFAHTQAKWENISLYIKNTTYAELYYSHNGTLIEAQAEGAGANQDISSGHWRSVLHQFSGKIEYDYILAYVGKNVPLAPIDTTAPTYSNNQSNTTTPNPNEWVSLNVTWTDANAAQAWFSNNFSGSWINSSLIDYTTGVAVNNVTQVIATVNDIICWKAYANDSFSNINETTEMCMTVIAIPDITLPSFTNLANNASTISKLADNVNFSVTIADNINLSSFIFSWNDSGSWANDSASVIQNNLTNVNSVKTITSTRGNYVCGRFHANDTSDNWNESLLSCFTVANTIPATPINLTVSANKRVTEDLYSACSVSDVDGDGLTYYYEYYNNNDATILVNYSTNQNYTIAITDAHDSIRVRCNVSDGYDNSPSYDEVNVTVENTLLTITLGNPITNLTDNVNLSTNATINDADSDSVDCYLYVNSSLNSSKTVTLAIIETLNANVSPLTDTYSWYWNCSDSYNTTLSATRRWTHDEVSPSLSYTILSITSDNWISYDATASDDTTLLIWNVTLVNSSGASSSIYYNDSINESSLNKVLNISLANCLNQECVIANDIWDTHTYGDLADLTYTYNSNQAELTFYDYNAAYSLEFGYYSNGDVHRISHQQISSFNIEPFIIEVDREYHFGARFNLPASDFRFGFRMADDIPNLRLINQDKAHFTLLNEFYIDYPATICSYDEATSVRSNCRKGSPSLIHKDGYYYIYYDYDLKNWYEVNERLVFATQSTGRLNNYQENITIAQDNLAPSITATSPANNSVSSTASVNFRFTATEDNPAQAVLYIDEVLNTTLGSWSSGVDTSLATLTFANGNYNYSILVNDSASQTDTSDILFFTVTVTPTITGASVIPLEGMGNIAGMIALFLLIAGLFMRHMMGKKK